MDLPAVNFLKKNYKFKTNFAKNILKTLGESCETKKCGTGATCTLVNGVATCSCGAGKTGDPNKRCCGVKQLQCR